MSMRYKESQRLLNTNKSDNDTEDSVDPNSFKNLINKRWADKRATKISNESKTDAAIQKRQQKELEIKQQENDERGKKLDEREKNLDEREALMNTLFADRETQLNVKSNVLLTREKAVEAKEILLDQRENLLQEKQREKELDGDKHSQLFATTPIRKRRGPSKRLKPYSELSRSQKQRRKIGANRLGVSLPPDTASALKVMTECGIPQKTVRHINAISPKFFPSEHTYQKEKKKILNGVDWENAPLVGTKSDKVISFAQSLMWRIQNIGPEYLPEVPQRTLKEFVLVSATKDVQQRIFALSVTSRKLDLLVQLI
uniref:Uncharacterized protein n=1 Tax=Panagrolaimus superbus TaxID=310955 RepID=A0A914XXC6_9BILA